MDVVARASDRGEGAFEHDARKALSRLCLSLRNVVSALPDQTPSASALAKVLGLNRKIAWQVWRITETDPVHGITPSAQLLPGPAALEGFLSACSVRGVPEPLLDAVRQASGRFDDLAVLHGGDRASLMSLFRQAGGPEGSTSSDRAAESVRRQAWQSNGEIWGTQTRAYFAAAILAPGSQDGRVDDLSITGEVGIRRLRNNAVRMIAGLGFHKYSADAGGPPAPRPLVEIDLESGTGMIEPMVPRFTSARVRMSPAESSPPGQTLVELVESPVGRRGEVNLVLAQFCPNIGRRYATDTLKRVHFSAHLFSPYGVVVQDLIVRRDLWPNGACSAGAKVYSALRGMMTSQSRRDERDVLPIRAEVVRLGAGLRALATDHVPEYAEIVEWGCAQVGWNPEEFEVHRCVVMYPPMPSSLVVGVDLPEN
jgi:hypothetical protein